MDSYIYPSIIVAYSMFVLFVVGAIYFLIRSRRDGYWGEHSEDVKYRMLRDEESQDAER